MNRTENLPQVFQKKKKKEKKEKKQNITKPYTKQKRKQEEIEFHNSIQD